MKNLIFNLSEEIERRPIRAILFFGASHFVFFLIIVAASEIFTEYRSIIGKTGIWVWSLWATYIGLLLMLHLPRKRK